MHDVTSELEEKGLTIVKRFNFYNIKSNNHTIINYLCDL